MLDYHLPVSVLTRKAPGVGRLQPAVILHVTGDLRRFRTGPTLGPSWSGVLVDSFLLVSPLGPLFWEYRTSLRKWQSLGVEILISPLYENPETAWKSGPSNHSLHVQNCLAWERRPCKKIGSLYLFQLGPGWGLRCPLI